MTIIWRFCSNWHSSANESHATKHIDKYLFIDVNTLLGAHPEYAQKVNKSCSWLTFFNIVCTMGMYRCIDVSMSHANDADVRAHAGVMCCLWLSILGRFDGDWMKNGKTEESEGRKLCQGRTSGQRSGKVNKATVVSGVTECQTSVGMTEFNNKFINWLIGIAFQRISPYTEEETHVEHVGVHDICKYECHSMDFVFGNLRDAEVEIRYFLAACKTVKSWSCSLEVSTSSDNDFLRRHRILLASFSLSPYFASFCVVASGNFIAHIEQNVVET